MPFCTLTYSYKLSDKLKWFPVVINIMPQILSKELNVHLNNCYLSNTSCLQRKRLWMKQKCAIWFTLKENSFRDIQNHNVSWKALQHISVVRLRTPLKCENEDKMVHAWPDWKINPLAQTPHCEAPPTPKQTFRMKLMGNAWRYSMALWKMSRTPKSCP